ncbi:MULTISPECIES: hypothetical protein [unclassified Paenibacillus]|uniref:hypothetical protein n=1 Tax=unclassified Paenibacillus TaxID=185978 RepID=UPI00048B4014|nr:MULTISPECIES: hypothetical protein [unclassified Paenibacillus]SDE39134.1 hypothetical protein SAMN04488689_101321 [Paenibacillus sp. cl6col]
MTWDIIRIPWTTYRGAEATERLPEALLQLKDASTIAEAELASVSIESIVVVQGALYEVAVPTAICLLSMIQNTTDTARPYMLELLVLIASGEPADLELEYGNPRLADACKREVARGTAVYAHLLENGRAAERLHCIDLLGLCAKRDRTVRERVRWMFRRVLQSERDERIREFLSYWLRELV